VKFKDGGISGDVSLIGTTPTFTIGDAGAEDAALVFDGNAQDFYIALDDSADDLLIGLGSTVGTTPAIQIDENLQVNVKVTTASTSATTGALVVGGGAGIAADLSVGDDLRLISDAAVLTFGADSEITLTHSADVGLNLKHTATADDKPIVLTLQTGETDMAADDVIGKIAFQAPDEGTGTDAILVSGAIQAVAEGDHSSSSNATRLEFMTGASEAATTKMSVSSGGDVKFNSGFGSVTTVFGCRAWANVDQTGTTEIQASGGVSSITDTGTGATDVNFSTDMPDGDYSMMIAPGSDLMATANQQFPVAVGNDGVANVDKGIIASRQCDNDAATFTTADASQICVAFFR